MFWFLTARVLFQCRLVLRTLSSFARLVYAISMSTYPLPSVRHKATVLCLAKVGSSCAGVCSAFGANRISFQLTHDVVKLDECIAGCASSYMSSSQGMCHHSNQTRCTQENNQWSNGVCTVSANSASDCATANAANVWSQCSDFSNNQTTCSANQFQHTLGCMWQYIQCPDQASCLASGQCSDWELQNQNNPGSNPTGPQGVCVFPPAYSNYGEGATHDLCCWCRLPFLLM